MLLLFIAPSLSYAVENYDVQTEGLNQKSNINLEDAEILIMMNTRGEEILASHMIHNFNQEEVFFITIKENNYINTYLVEQDGSYELVEKRSNKKEEIIF